MQSSREATVAPAQSLNVDLRSRFLARVALASGQFVYGKMFRTYAKCADLQTVVRYGLTPPPNLSADVGVRLLDPFIHEISGPAKTIAELCTSLRDSRVAVVPAPEGIHFFVGVLGEFLGMIFVDADTKNLPNTGRYRFGHVVTFSKPTTCTSLEEALRSHPPPVTDPSPSLRTSCTGETCHPASR
jgi:hypothetical protein